MHDKSIEDAVSCLRSKDGRPLLKEVRAAAGDKVTELVELVREEFNAHATAPKYSQISNHVKALRQATEALLAEQERMA